MTRPSPDAPNRKTSGEPARAGRWNGVGERHGVGLSRRRVLLGLGALLAGCYRHQADETPEGATKAWLDLMQKAHADPAANLAAFELLSQSSKENLQERARRATAATGRTIAPEEMLVASRFSLRFAPRQMKARIAGDRAIVDVTGGDTNSERAAVRCVREDGKWRVDLMLPPLPAIEKRPDAG